MKFLQKILGLCLISMVTLPLLMVTSLQTQAVGEVIVKIGNHNLNEDTNMVIEVVLEVDMPNGSWLDLYFDNVLGEDDLTIDDVNVRAFTAVPPNSRVMEDITTTLYQQTTVNDAIQFNSLGRDLYAGDTIYYYLGMPDNVDLGYVTGESDFKPLPTSSNLFTNAPSGSNAIITIDTNVAGNDGMKGAYALVADQQIVLEGVVDPYISMTLGGNTMSLESDPQTVSTDTITVNIKTNAKDGYNWSYRSTPLTYDNDPGITVNEASGEALVAGVEDWGVNIHVVSFQGASIYTYPLTQNFYYKVVTDNSLQFLSRTYGPVVVDFEFHVGMTSSTVTTAGDYSGLVTLNVYGTF